MKLPASKRRKNNVKSTIFMFSVIATIILAIMAPVLLWRNHRVSAEYKKYKDYIETRKKVESLLSEVPHGRIEFDATAKKLRGRADGYEFTYTVDPRMQKNAERILSKHDPFTGAIVVMDPGTGAVRVMASYTRRRKEYYEAYPYSSILDPVARNSIYPMASIQKIITASAAIETGITTPSDTLQCNGHLKDETSGKIIRCSRGGGAGHGRVSVTQALASSCNVVFALLALELKRDMLEEYYRRFMFNRKIDFDMPLAESVIMIQPGDYNLERAGAGLDGARVSPLHAAMVAAAIQNGGVMMRPFIVESIQKEGKLLQEVEPEEIGAAVKPETAEAVAKMMESTVKMGGSGYRKFGKVVLVKYPSLKVSAKTGSLNDTSPQEHFTWFVGFMDNGGKKLAFAFMMMSDEAHTELHSVSLAREFFLSILHEK